MATAFDTAEIEPFRCEVEPRRDVVYVRPFGELDLLTVPVLERELKELAGAGFARLVLDLRGLRFLDSTGLRLILEWDAKARSDGLSFAVIRGPAAVHRLFELTGTTQTFSFVEPAASRS
jgi:anti-sigma B factor antagonist